MTGATLIPTNVVLRHVVVGAQSDPGAVAVLDAWLVPQPLEGLNGAEGWTGGVYDRRRDSPGEFSITVPNAPGGDGTEHRDRFRLLSDPEYAPGDEWIEIWQSSSPIFLHAGELLFVGTPTDRDVGLAAITISGYDAAWLLNRERETAAGIHTATAPAAFFRDYLSRWVTKVNDDFDAAADGSARFSQSTSVQTTADGAWSYLRAQGAGGAFTPGQVRLSITDVSAAYLQEPGGEWTSIEVVINTDLAATLDPDTVVRIGWPLGALATYGGTWIDLFKDPSGNLKPMLETYHSTARYPSGPGYLRRALPASVMQGGGKSYKLEIRDGWAYAYVDGVLHQVIDSGGAGNAPTAVYLERFSGSGTRQVNVSRIDVRHREEFLAGAPGDLRLPVALDSRGLLAEFYDDAAIYAELNTGYFHHTLAPTDEPYHRRIDQAVDFTSGAWHPPGPYAGEKFSGRWTGAIYLDLDQYDYAFRINYDDRARVFLAGTKILDSWTLDSTSSPPPKTSAWVTGGGAGASAPGAGGGILDGQSSGWYPIVVEFGNHAGPASVQLQAARSDAVGTWTSVGADSRYPVAPAGVERGQVRGESHASMLERIVETWGYQWTCEPRSLESGEFPGVIVPRVRVGRDTDYVLTDLEGTDPRSSGDAKQVTHRLTLDAQGLSDAQGAAQITREVSRQVIGATDRQAHLMHPSDYDSIADISEAELAVARAISMLAVRSGPWEEIQIRPDGRSQLAGRFRLPEATLERFAWDPGDGLQIRYPELLINDQEPRQILVARWPIVPKGRGRPEVSFSQRVRDEVRLLKSILRTALNGDRHYQGQILSSAGDTARDPVDAATPSAVSRVMVPADHRVKKVELEVFSVSSGASKPVYVNGVATTLTIVARGVYDISRYFSRHPSEPGFMEVTMPGGTGSALFRVQVLYTA